MEKEDKEYNKKNPAYFKEIMIAFSAMTGAEGFEWSWSSQVRYMMRYNPDVGEIVWIGDDGLHYKMRVEQVN